MNYATINPGIPKLTHTRTICQSSDSFRGHIFDRVCQQHGVQHKLTKPYHPWTHGQAERMNRTVKHPLPHHETATAWFEYGQTLVTLPLNNSRSSAVMTLGEADAAALMQMDDAAFGLELTRRYRGRLGAMRPGGGMRFP